MPSDSPLDLTALTAQSKSTGWLPIAPRPDGSMWQLPVLAARGATDGPTLLVLAGVHGDEYEGIEAIPQAWQQVDPATLRGTLIMLPVCNLPAYEMALRSSPIDGLNLARVFPGSAEGSVTERIAHILTEEAIRHADFVLDLHSGGAYYNIPTLVGYLHDDGDVGQRSRAGAEAFGAPVIWGHPLPMPPGRTISAANELGIPWLYTEAPGGGYARPDDVAIFRRGVLNLMRHLGMLDGAPELGPVTHRLVGDGNLDRVINAPVGGFFRAALDLLTPVKTGDLLGTVTDFFGTVQAEITAPIDGTVIMLRRYHRIHTGEGVAQITHKLDE